jgi:hypothetical protein
MMGRKRKKTRPTVEETHGARVDAMMEGLHESLAKELGSDRVRSQDEITRRMIGIPVPGLAFRYLIQQDVLPLGRILTINGLESSCKSSLMYEIMRWHMVYGGMSLLLENESKDSPDIRMGIWDHNDDFLNNKSRIVQTLYLDDWQNGLTRGLSACQDMMTVRGGPGRSVPVVFGVDSLTSKMSEEGAKKVVKTGHTERGEGRTVALKLTEYFQWLPSQLIDWPFSVVCIQHLKKNKDPRTGMLIRSKPGGRHVAFMETFEFEMSRGRDIQHVDDGGVNLTIETRKNSLGPARIKLDVIFRWWWEDDPVTGERIQKHVFDWDDASMNLLIGFAKDKKTIWKRVIEIVDLHPKISLRKVWSRELGIPETSPISYAEAYRMIERDRPDILLELYKILGIRRRRPLSYGQDFLSLVNSKDGGIPTGPPEPTLYMPPRVEAAEVGADLTPSVTPEEESSVYGASDEGTVGDTGPVGDQGPVGEDDVIVESGDGLL